MLDFEEIEDCFPERGALCAIDGRVTVSAQWLHDFAHKVATKERDACTTIVFLTRLEAEADDAPDHGIGNWLIDLENAIRMRSNVI